MTSASKEHTAQPGDLSQPTSCAADNAAQAVRECWQVSGRQPWLVTFRNPFAWERLTEGAGVQRWRHRVLRWILARQPDGFRHVVLSAPIGEKPDGRRIWLRIDPQATGVQVAAVLDGGLEEDLSAGRTLVAAEDRSPPDPLFWGIHCCANHAAAVLKQPVRGLWTTPKALYDRLLADGAVHLTPGGASDTTGGAISD